MGILEKIFGGSAKKEVNRISKIVEKINALEPLVSKLSDSEIKEKTNQLKERIRAGETTNDVLPEAFALAREAGKRVSGERLFDVQLIGAVALHEGKITEMKTGEGKTLTAVPAVYLNALSGKGVHVVTVNDYLSRRDAAWMGAIYYFLGLSTACINHDISYLYQPTKDSSDESVLIEGVLPAEKQLENLKIISRNEAYLADVTYGTNNEFGFDYLRDNMAPSLDRMVQRPLHFAIVDEVDSILIDEARTPLIISAPDSESTKMYDQFARLVPRLKENEDYNVDEKMKSVMITAEGIAKMEKWLGIGNIYESGKVSYVHHLEQALKANIIFKKDRDYVVKDGEVIIVDDFTGRLMPGRRYSEGLHQAIEAKEGVKVQKESRTLASITFQNYFRMYEKLAGMTGTAVTSAEEFFRVYKLEVVQVPTHRPMIRKDLPDVVYKTELGKFQAIVKKIKELNLTGQPVLVGTIAIEKSEQLSKFLEKEGIRHEVLNAKNHQREAQIIALAGQRGSVTIATNMAGRGTDIKLGEGVKELGGLYIIGTERHEARRIDDQLRGRSGRQGDPGITQFYISLEDELMRRFGGEKLKNLMDKLGLPEDQPIENKIISRSIESAQGRIEGFNFDIRKHVLEYDDVLNKQREVIYKKRKDILTKNQLKSEIEEMIVDEAENIVAAGTFEMDENAWNTEELAEEVKALTGTTIEGLHRKLLEIKMAKNYANSAEKKAEMVNQISQFLKTRYLAREKEFGPSLMREVERAIYLRTLDSFWMDHLDEIDYLRDSIGLQGYGQRDPLIEYKRQAFGLFQKLLANINETVIKGLFSVRLNFSASESDEKAKNLQYSGGEESGQFEALNGATDGNQVSSKKEEKVQPIVNQDKIGRNDPCPCGSGKKYKKCCGK